MATKKGKSAKAKRKNKKQSSANNSEKKRQAKARKLLQRMKARAEHSLLLQQFQASKNEQPQREELKQEVKQNDPVNRPKHYTDGKIEVIDFIEDKKLGFHLGNSVKYIARAGKKDPSKEIEDLKKAQWYLNRRIENLENEKKLQPIISMTNAVPIVAGLLGAGCLAYALKKAMDQKQSKKK